VPAPATPDPNNTTNTTNPLDNLQLLDTRADMAAHGISVLAFNHAISDKSKGISMFTQTPLGQAPCPCAGIPGAVCPCKQQSNKKVVVIRTDKYSPNPRGCGTPGAVNCNNPRQDNDRNLGPLPDNHMFARMRVAHPISTTPTSLIVPGLLVQPVYDVTQTVVPQSSHKSEASVSHASESSKHNDSANNNNSAATSAPAKPEPKINLDIYDKEVFDMLQRLHKLTSFF
jgi:hypothetical protein